MKFLAVVLAGFSSLLVTATPLKACTVTSAKLYIATDGGDEQYASTTKTNGFYGYEHSQVWINGVNLDDLSLGALNSPSACSGAGPITPLLNPSRFINVNNYCSAPYVSYNLPTGGSIPFYVDNVTKNLIAVLNYDGPGGTKQMASWVMEFTLSDGTTKTIYSNTTDVKVISDFPTNQQFASVYWYENNFTPGAGWHAPAQVNNAAYWLDWWYSGINPPFGGIVPILSHDAVATAGSYDLYRQEFLMGCATTPTFTSTRTSTSTSTRTRTITPSATLTLTSTVTPSSTPSKTSTSTPSVTPSQTPSVTQTVTGTVTPSNTSTFTVSSTRTETSLNTATSTPSVTPTFTVTPSRTITLTATPTMTPTSSWTDTSTRTITATESSTKTPTSTSTVSPTLTQSPINSPTSSPTDTDTRTETLTRTGTPTITVTSTPTGSPTDTPTFTGTPTETLTRTPSLTVTVTFTITVSPTFSVTRVAVPYRLRVSVYNSAGERVLVLYDGSSQVPAAGAALQGGGLVPGEAKSVLILSGRLADGRDRIDWAGQNDQGQPVSGGIYRLSVEEWNPFGDVTTYSTTLEVIPASEEQFLRVYNSAGEVIQAYPLPVSVGTAWDLQLSSDNDTLAVGQNEAGNLAFKVQGERGKVCQVLWDGRNAAGMPVASGDYYVQLAGPGDGTRARTVSVKVIRIDDRGALANIWAGPNPMPVKVDQLTVGGLPVGEPVDISVYSLAGERIAGASGSGPRITVSLQDKSYGLAIVAVELVAQRAHVLRKVALLR